jgi:hypothetical protein
MPSAIELAGRSISAENQRELGNSITAPFLRIRMASRRKLPAPSARTQ